MSTAAVLGIILIVLGVLVLLFGRRVWVFAAGAGALLGVGFLNLIPGQQTGAVALLLPFGLAIVGALLGLFVKGIAHIIAMIFGFIAGGAIVLALFGALGIQSSFLTFLIAAVGGLVGLVLVNRFVDWGILILAALVGALLVVRGFQIFLPSINSTVAMLIGLVLFVLGFWFQMRRMRPAR
jgi:hypothetical protein